MPVEIVKHTSTPRPPVSIVTRAGERITTNRTLMADLRASLALRGIPAGTTFGDFILAARLAGVTDQTPLDSIEYGVARFGTGNIVADFEGDAVSLKEVV